MSEYTRQWLQILMVAVNYTSPESENESPPPSKEEREKADKDLRTLENDLKSKTAKVEESTRLRLQLEKTLEGMEKIYPPFAKEAEDTMTAATKRREEALKRGAGIEDADALLQQAKAVEAEAAAMKKTIENIRQIQKKSKEDAEKGTTDINRTRRELQTALATYFKTADPKMIADRYGVPLEGNVSFDANPEFVDRTKTPGSTVPANRFGMGAEHTWDNRYTIPDGTFFGRPVILKSISQHEHITTRVMFDTANELLQRHKPGLTAPVVRFGMTITDDEIKRKPEAYTGVFGHPVDAFRPTVINNSTSSGYSLEKEETFRMWMQNCTKGEGTKTIKSFNGSITYGLPPLSRAIVGNAAGNAKWAHVPDPSWIKNFHPSHMNIGVSAIPPVEGGKKRDDTAPSHIEEYSTQNAGVHAIIQRPRWHSDGSPIHQQYLNRNYERIVEENLWKLTGRPGIPKPEELDDVTKTPTALLKALTADRDTLISSIRSREQADITGINTNLRGTSFAAPTANGVILAASILYPEASNAELIDAFCSSCVPIIHREIPPPFYATDMRCQSVKDVPYLTDPKSGRIYSPMAGFGEFTLDPKATKEKPDSWLRFTQRLEAMQKERHRLTKDGRLHSQVDVGEGTHKRRVSLNGQPVACTIELNKGAEFQTAEHKKIMAGFVGPTTEAIRDIDRYNDCSIAVGDDSPILKLVNAHKYYEALEMLQQDYKGKLVGSSDPYMQAAEAQLQKAVIESGHSYSFTVQESQDVCCTQAALRLKFKENNDIATQVILESPDGTRIPISLSDNNSGVAVCSTPGVMRKAAAGEWKLYVRRPIDMSNTSLVITGTERNPKLGIVDVRETILTEIEKKEAIDKAVPAANVMKPITSPYPYLREMAGKVEVQNFFLPSRTLTPSTREEFQQNLQKFIDGSELKKGGYIPKGTMEKISSSLTPATKMQTLATQIGGILTSAGCTLPLTTPTFPLPAHLQREKTLANLIG